MPFSDLNIILKIHFIVLPRYLFLTEFKDNKFFLSSIGSGKLFPNFSFGLKGNKTPV